MQRHRGTHVRAEHIALRISVEVAKLIAERIALAGADPIAHGESVDLAFAAAECHAVDLSKYRSVDLSKHRAISRSVIGANFTTFGISDNRPDNIAKRQSDS